MFCLCRPILERDIMMVCCWLILPITNRGKKSHFKEKNRKNPFIADFQKSDCKVNCIQGLLEGLRVYRNELSLNYKKIATGTRKMKGRNYH